MLRLSLNFDSNLSVVAKSEHNYDQYSLHSLNYDACKPFIFSSCVPAVDVKEAVEQLLKCEPVF